MNVTTADAAKRMAAAVGPTRRRSNLVTAARSRALSVASATTVTTAPVDAGSPSLLRASAERMLKRPPAKTLNATKYPNRVRLSRKTVPSPSQAATPNAPTRYQVR
jgi:hypothetical protein